MENKIKFSYPAKAFTESLVLGNGSLGAAIYGDPTNDRISLNHDTLWSGTPTVHKREGAYNALKKAQALAVDGKFTEAQNVIEDGFTSLWSAAYLPLGWLNILSDCELFDNYTRTLDISEGLATVEYRTDRGATKREYFVSHPDRCLAVRIAADTAHSYVIQPNSLLRYTVRTDGNMLVLSGKCPSTLYPDGHLPNGEEQITYGDGAITFTTVIGVKTDGTVTADGNSVLVKDARELEIYSVTETSFISPTEAPVREHESIAVLHMSSLLTMAYSEIRERHVSDFCAIYSRTSFELYGAPTDADTWDRIKTGEGKQGLYELIFNFAKYLTISASRSGTRAMNLQGIWNELMPPPWQSNYTVNINLEMNYWPTLSLGMPEFTDPLTEQIKAMHMRGKEVARHYYNADGFVAHHNSDIWAMTSPVGYLTRGSARWAFWNGSSGWLCRHLYEKYEYTTDTEFLRMTAYPIMKDAALFYLDIFIRDEDGRLILCPSTSPENAFIENGKAISICKHSAMSQYIAANLFRDVLRASEVLGINDSFTERVKKAISELRMPAIGSDGRLMEWDAEYPESEPHHRHVSHLYGLYPGELITTGSTPELARACRNVLEAREDESTGWSLAWKILLYAKLKDGDHALRLLDMQLRPVSSDVVSYTCSGGTYPNMLCAHPPFQIDGNFGAAAGIINMLMQCEDGVIRILPALPSSWKDGKISGICAKGGITVSIEWKDGQPSRVTLVSKKDTSATIVMGANGEAVAYALEKDIPMIICNAEKG